LTSAPALDSEYDDSAFPLVLVRPARIVTDDQNAAFLAALARPLLRRERYAMVVDATRLDAGTAPQRRKLADWIREHRALGRLYVLGTGVVMPSPVVRGALTAVLWLQPATAPVSVTSTMAEAERWAVERLVAAGLPVPARYR